MNAQQKVAWFNLAVFTAAVAAYGVLVPIMGPSPALGAFGILGMWGLTPFFFRRRNAEVLVDERDEFVNLRGFVVGAVVFWLCFVAVCMTTWGVIRYWKHQETVSVDILPVLVGGGMIVLMLSHSVAMLIQYQGSRGREHE